MNQLQRQQEVESTRFVASKQDQEIIQAINSNVSIRSTKDDEPIKQALRYVFTLIGLKAEQIPSDIEKAVLLKFIRENYPKYHPNEIRIAFELAIKSEFKAEVNHYGTFSSLYLAGILNAYKDHRAAVFCEAAKIKKAEQKSLPEPEPSEQFKQQVRNEYLLNVGTPIFERFKQTGKLRVLESSVQILYNALFASFGELSHERKTIIKEEAIERLKTEEKALKESKSVSIHEHKLKEELLKAIQTPEKKEDVLREKCFEIAIEKLFTELIESNTDLKSKINEQSKKTA
jgi:hypothetical protein